MQLFSMNKITQRSRRKHSMFSAYPGTTQLLESTLILQLIITWPSSKKDIKTKTLTGFDTIVFITFRSLLSINFIQDRYRFQDNVI